MSDIFAPITEKTEQPKINGSNYFSDLANEQKEKNAARLVNRKNYGIDLSDEEYQTFNSLIANSENPENEAYKIGLAIKFSKELGISVQDAYQNMDNYLNALYEASPSTDYKKWYETVSDMFVMGKNNVRVGQLGNLIREAEINGDEDGLKVYNEELAALEADNELRLDNAPRSWATTALKYGAQSLPFTGYVASAGMFGNFIAPGVGTAAGFAASSSLTAGQEYIDMRKNGASVETASIVSGVSGALQGVVEVALGDAAAYLGTGAKTLGGKVIGEQIRDTITNNMLKALHFKGGSKLLANAIERYAMENIEEGAEEVIQNFISIGGQVLAAELEGYNVPADVAADIAAQSWENFKGGVLGSIVLGGLPLAVNSHAALSDYKSVKKLAGEIKSEQMFKNAVKDSVVFEGIEGEKLSGVIHDIWQNAQTARDAAENLKAKEIAEVNTAAEGFENIEEDENGEVNAPAVYRNENGELATSTITNGNNEQFRIGDQSKENQNLYGYIDSTIDNDNNTVTINTFSMNEAREGLRQEVFEQFAKQHAGQNIVWNTKGKLAESLKQDLINNNPSGKNNGLNYFANEQEVLDTMARRDVAEQLKKNMPNITDEERPAAVAILEGMARSQGMNISDYINRTFGANIFGDRETLENAAAQKGQVAKGGMNLRILSNGIKAVIYAGENADFSTWAHELSHVYQTQLTGDLRNQAEKAFNVVNGDWDHSMYTFIDGHQESAAEAFARGFEDYLQTGKAENEELKNIFQKLAEFMAAIYNGLKNHINLTDDIKKIYDKMLNLDKSVLVAAENAIKSQEKQKNAVEEKQDTKIIDNEVNFTETAEKENPAEDFADINNPTAEELAAEVEKLEAEEMGITEADIEQNVNEYNANRDAVEKTTTNLVSDNVTAETAKNTAEILNNPDASTNEKAEATADAAGEAAEDTMIIFQLVNSDIVQNATASNFKSFALNNLKTAERLKELKQNDYTIKRLTGWQLINNEWKLETNDNLRVFNIDENGNNFGKLFHAVRNNPNSIINRTFSLSDIINDPELFKIYPKVKNLKISFINDVNNYALHGIYNGTIQINIAWLDKNDRTERGLFGALSHEIQHVIQIEEELYKVNSVPNYNTESLAKAQQIYLTEQGELEAKAAAKRIVTSDNLRRNSLFFDDIENKIKFQIEEDGIRSQFENTDKWMKAPNGAKTNLTEKQWLQVRTENFKNWFGDWENSPEDASKAVDENGEPKIFYHGSPKDFTTFEKRGYDHFYFVENEDHAKTYSENKNVYATYLNIRNPKKIDFDGASYLGEFDTAKEVWYKIKSNDDWKQLKDINKTHFDTSSFTFDDLIKKINAAENSNFKSEDELDNIEFRDSKELEHTTDGEATIAKNEGFDSLIIQNVNDVGQYDTGFYQDADEYIVFNSNQIKSATDNNGNFDINNTDIRLQEDEYNPRSFVPAIRGKWTEAKIIKYLKNNPTRHGVLAAAKLMAEFDSPEELKEHMFYHGTAHGSEELKPSITMSDREAERLGGGGYGQKYWSISVSKDKKIASNFSGPNDYVHIYPIVLAKNAKVIEMPEITDSIELEDHIIDLWTDGVDAVWIGEGKQGGGEQELSIINPRAVVNIGNPSSYKVYRLGSEENPINIKNDEQIKKMYDFAKNYVAKPKSEYAFGKPRKPNKPNMVFSPSNYLYDNKFNIIGEKPEAQYKEEYAKYEEDLKNYNEVLMPKYEEEMSKYEEELKAWQNSEGYKNYWDLKNLANKEIRFQTAADAQTMYGVHNLSADALRHAAKIGGLANPSMAVVDTDKTNFKDFGGISLIPYNFMLTKSEGKNAGTFGADIYSPRYPSINRTVTSAGRKTISNIFNKIEDENLKRDLVEKTAQKIENDRKPSFLYTPLTIAYLMEKGNTDFIKYEKSVFSDDVKEKFKKLDPTADVLEEKTAKFLLDVYKQQQYGSYKDRLAELEKKVDTSKIKGVLKENIEKYKQYIEIAEEVIQESIDPDTGYLNFNIADNLYYKIKKDVNSAGKVDLYKTEDAAREILKDDKDFEKWAEEKYNEIEVDEKIFNGYKADGTRKYLSHTLANVSKYMKQQGLQGGENFNYGLGSTRAKFAPKFTTLAQIKKARNRLVTKEEFEKIKEEYNNEYEEITEILRDGLSDFDAGEARFEEAFTTPGVNPIQYLRDEYDININEETAKRILDFAASLREMPTEYFETKFERPVYLNEFAAAIIPSDTPEDVKQILKDNGIFYVKEYDVKKDNRLEVTNQAVKEFNEKRRIMFQTEQELYNDAKKYETWQDFQEAYETDFDPAALEDPLYHSQVPSEANAQWYQTTWEAANGIKTEQQEIEEELTAKQEKDGMLPPAIDAMFTSDMATRPGMLEDFLLRLNEIDQFNFDEYAPQDEQEQKELEDLQAAKDLISIKLTHGSWLSNAVRIAKGEDLSDTQKRLLLTLIRRAPRDYRAIYSAIMQDESYAVAAEDTPAAQLANKLRKYKLVSPNEDLEKKTPEQIRRLADELNNKEVAEKIKNGTMPMDDELYNYVKSLNRQVKEAQKDLDELEKETASDYQRIADAQQRELVRMYDNLLKKKSEYNRKNDDVTRKIDKGLKISGAYRKDLANARANYNEIFRKFNDLKNTIKITAEVEQALQNKDKVYVAREELKSKQQEKNLMQEIKKMRVQLVKRVMRRVPFARIDYDSARTLIAIQRIFEPNLFGGVNRWIGTEGPYLRGIISNILTDTDYRNSILKFLEKSQKSSQAFNEFKTLLENTKSIEYFNKWTLKDRKRAIRYLPKENWIRELNLKKLAEEREESIDLPIEMIEKKQAVKNDKGEIVYRKDADGNDVPYYTTTFVLNVAKDIEQLVKDAVGADIYNNLVNRPFADWTTEEMEKLAIVVNKIYTEGRDILEAKRQVKKEAAEAIRKAIENTVRNTNIIINEDDSPEDKKRKQDKINKILGLNSDLKGTAEAKKESRINRLLHGYADANILRVARILDGNKEGINVNELYRKEDNCYRAKQREIDARAENITRILAANNLTINDLNKEIEVQFGPTTRIFTVDELLYFLSADEDYLDDTSKITITSPAGSLAANDNAAPTSRNAVMFGVMYSAAEDQAQKEAWAEEYNEIKRKIAEDDFTPEERQQIILKQFDFTAGLSSYINECKARYEIVLNAAKQLEIENPALHELRKAIAEDYANQYDRMNEISIAEFNAPVHRTKCYVPLVRLESNGDTNANTVKEDLLATSASGKEWADKGMTKRRVNMSPLNQKPVETGLYKTWTKSVDRTEHFISYAPYVNELNRVYKSRDAQYTRRFIENRYGKGMISYIDEYINEVANPNAGQVHDAGDMLIRTLRGKTAPAYLAWKMSAIIKQAATSPWPYMQFISPAEYIAAAWDIIGSHGKTYDAIKEKSVFMKNRVMDPMNDLIEELSKQRNNKGTFGKIENAINNFSKKGMAGLEWIDWNCVAPGWFACYKKKYAELNANANAIYEAEKIRLTEENAFKEVGSSAWKNKEQIENLAHAAADTNIEELAVQYADDCTRQCQPSSRKTDIAPLFKNSSEAMKAYLQFQTSLNVIWQNIRYDIPYAVRNNETMRVAGIIAAYVFAGIAMNTVVYGLKDDDDEELQALKNLIWYSTTQFTDSTPIIGSGISTAMQKVITGKSSYFGANGTDMTPLVTKFMQAATNASKGDFNKAAGSFAEGIGLATGLPVSGSKELLKVFGIGNKEGGYGLKSTAIIDNDITRAIDKANPINN